jgi:hypothetical protein
MLRRLEEASPEKVEELIFSDARSAYLAQQEERSHRAVHGDDQVGLAGPLIATRKSNVMAGGAE